MKAKKPTNMLLAAGIALAFGAGSVQAQQSSLSYNFVDVLYHDGEVLGRDQEAVGARVSFALNESFFLKGSMIRGKTDHNVSPAGKLRLRGYSAGVGYRVAINQSTDLVTGFEYVREDYRFPAVRSRDRKGFAADMGIRTMFTDNVEFQGGIVYRDARDFNGDLGFQLETRLHLSPMFAVTLGYQDVDEVDGLHAGLRFSF